MYANLPASKASCTAGRAVRIKNSHSVIVPVDTDSADATSATAHASAASASNTPPGPSTAGRRDSSWM
ncbi:hypothetical protein ASG56_20010 [Rhodococcus sp. Leaf7]|nr:hypothetical protein ASG56_20010 [Rhodococcus sp. Leaf7]